MTFRQHSVGFRLIRHTHRSNSISKISQYISQVLRRSKSSLKTHDKKLLESSATLIAKLQNNKI